MFTLQSSLHCVVSNWTTTTKLGICSQVSVCATFFDFRTDKMCRELKIDHMFFCISVFLAGTFFSFKRFVPLEVFTFQVAISLVNAKGVKCWLIRWHLPWFWYNVTQQEVCGEMEEFLLASVIWWSPGTTCHSHKKRISTTDTRSAVNVGWVKMLTPLWGAS